jgi:5-methyltetrahydropteroyltriglutamate--homocysteine methyltransferase
LLRRPVSRFTSPTRIHAALIHLPPERLIPAPDCGMKYIPCDLAVAKLKALAEGAAIVRRELTAS